MFQTSAQPSFRVLCLVCHRPVPDLETASSSCLQLLPSQHETEKTNDLNLFVPFEILSGTGRSAQSWKVRWDLREAHVHLEQELGTRQGA